MRNLRPAGIVRMVEVKRGGVDDKKIMELSLRWLKAGASFSDWLARF